MENISNRTITRKETHNGILYQGFTKGMLSPEQR